MDKLKSVLLGFVKPLILGHVQDLSMLTPLMVNVITAKTNLSPDQAKALSAALIDVVESELVALINKL